MERLHMLPKPAVLVPKADVACNSAWMGLTQTKGFLVTGIRVARPSVTVRGAAEGRELRTTMSMETKSMARSMPRRGRGRERIKSERGESGRATVMRSRMTRKTKSMALSTPMTARARPSQRKSIAWARVPGQAQERRARSRSTEGRRGQRRRALSTTRRKKERAAMTTKRERTELPLRQAADGGGRTRGLAAKARVASPVEALCARKREVPMTDPTLKAASGRAPSAMLTRN